MSVRAAAAGSLNTRVLRHKREEGEVLDYQASVAEILQDAALLELLEREEGRRLEPLLQSMALLESAGMEVEGDIVVFLEAGEPDWASVVLKVHVPPEVEGRLEGVVWDDPDTPFVALLHRSTRPNYRWQLTRFGPGGEPWGHTDLVELTKAFDVGPMGAAPSGGMVREVHLVDGTVLVRPGLTRLPNFAPGACGALLYDENVRRHNDLLTPHRYDDEDLIELLREVGGVSKQTAQAILSAFPQTSGLEDASVRMLMELGANEKQARRILGAFAMVRACDEACQGRVMGTEIRTPQQVVALLRHEIGHRNQEYFVVVMLDARNKVIDLYGVAVGSLAEVAVHPREVFRKAIATGAHSVVVAHNHPTGNASPSDADLDLTNRLVEVGLNVGIPVVDSLVIAPGEASSMAAAGLL